MKQFSLCCLYLRVLLHLDTSIIPSYFIEGLRLLEQKERYSTPSSVSVYDHQVLKFVLL